MLLIIDGWFGSGKSVLTSLLDSHNLVFVNHVHDATYSIFYDSTEHDSWIKDKDWEQVKKFLYQSDFNKFKLYYENRIHTMHFDATRYINFEYNIDFKEFENLFEENLKTEKIWSIEKIINILYQSYSTIALNENKQFKYYVTLSNPEIFESWNKIYKLYPNMKKIIIKRDIKDIVSARITRKSILIKKPKNFQRNYLYRENFDIFIQNNELNSILNYYKQAEIFAEKYPNSFILINFDDLIYNTENTMRKLCNFLNIEFSDILLQPTRYLESINKDGETFLNMTLDNHSQLLLEDEIAYISNKIKEFRSSYND